MLSASFFWYKALPKPPSESMYATPENIAANATSPKSLGLIYLANTIDGTIATI